jgi:hypothetical protein
LAGLFVLNGLLGLFGFFRLKGLFGLLGLFGFSGLFELFGFNGLAGLPGLFGLPGFNGLLGLLGLFGFSGLFGLVGLLGFGVAFGLLRPGPVVRVLLLPPDAAEPDEWIAAPPLTPTVCPIPTIDRLHKLTKRMIFIFMVFNDFVGIFSGGS